MSENIFFTVILAAALGSGLVAGILFIFSNTVMGALAELPPAQGIAGMQAINRIILNPLFFLAFMGTAAAVLFLVGSLPWRWEQPGALYLLAGGLLYLVGVILVTGIVNVPLNDALAAAAPDSDAAAHLWSDYLSRWTTWNHVRTVASLLGALAFTLALR